jgi:serine protease Do
LGNSDEVQVGHLVAALGSPFNHRGSLTQGIISAKHRRGLPLRGRGQRRLLNQDFLQTDAAINPGNSGGPLVNMRGEVIGINTAIASRDGGYQGVAFSVPINLVKRVVERLLSDGAVSRAFLGVDLVVNFTDQVAAQLGLERPRGAMIAGIYTSTPAESAGLRERDVILQLDGIEIEDHTHLINVVSLTPVGKEVPVVVWRERKRQQIVLKVGDRGEFEQRIGEVTRQRSERLNELVREAAAPSELAPLGLKVRALDAEDAASAGFGAQAGGLLVLEVDPQGLAAGQVEPFDLIEQAERKAVPTPTALQEIVDGLDLAEGVLLRLRRQSGSGVQTRVILVVR